ncbi:unnamed protein product [Zymoseptoria tritici ST99CH_1E4]|uniref:Uncharacterized protein n=1 Tax=Zymoseptoria tritici ST99CH_1E4 TaxID=1276532 RepID=A0A2H1FX31_ZYMTR|nr:unnamed protein product [Zymoseptoria tritici ST99CH_1E4]
MPSATEDLFFEGGWRDDDERIDLYALFVLEDVPIAEVEDVLRRNFEDSKDEHLWLAEDYNSLPDLPDIELDVQVASGTSRPLNPRWKSRFEGKTIQDAADFLGSVPKPRKPLCKTYFAVLNKMRYQEHDQILICKILENGQVQSIPCVATRVALFFIGYERDEWDESFSRWENDGLVLLAD